MEKKLNNKSGFTLIELIIVVIILGVIAGLALPRVVAQINRAYSTEATYQLGVIMRQIDQCVGASIVNGSTAAANLVILQNCDTLGEIGVAAPPVGTARFRYDGGVAASNFTTASVAEPALPAALVAGNTVAVTATFLAAPGGADFAPASTIRFAYDGGIGGVPVANKTSTGVFAGIQWQ